MLATRGWEPPALAVLGQPQGCSTFRLDIYDLKTRARVASTELPPPGSTGWEIRGRDSLDLGLQGNYVPVQTRKDDENVLLMVHVPSGRIAYDSQLSAELFESEKSRFFLSPFGHVFGWGDDVLVELNDTSVVELDQQNKTLEPTDKTGTKVLADYVRHMNTDAGCPADGSGSDDFEIEPHPGRTGSDFIGLAGIEFGIDKVVFNRDQKTTLTYSGNGERFETEPLFNPEVFVPFACESRPPAPILVWHRGHLDSETAPHLLSRYDGNGAKQWTVTMPVDLSNPNIRQLDDVIVLATQEQIVWIDLGKGEILHELEFPS